MINLSLRHVWIVLTVSALLLTAWMFRYETVATSNVSYIVKDRWTGAMSHCTTLTSHSPCHLVDSQ